MIALAAAAALALVVAADPSTPPRRTATAGSNAVRARAGLLPRKPARTRTDVRGRSLLTVSAPAPTFLAEPAPLAEASPERLGPDSDGDAAAPAEAAQERLRVARGPVETVRLPVEDTGAPEDPTDEPAPGLTPPEELGTLRVAARGVSTELSLSLRFDR